MSNPKVVQESHEASENNFPTAEEVCETIELMALFADEDDSTWNLLYRLTHCRKRDDRCKNHHEDWVEEFREAQAYVRNQNKAPQDPTKVRNIESSFGKIG